MKKIKKLSGKKSILTLLLVTAPLLASCSAKFLMPWEQNMLDPANVRTQEPLEIPPDLWTLPPTKDSAEENAEDKAAEQDVAGSEGTATSILFGGPEGVKDASSDRNENEALPAWLGGGNTHKDDAK